MSDLKTKVHQIPYLRALPLTLLGSLRRLQTLLLDLRGLLLRKGKVSDRRGCGGSVPALIYLQINH